MTSREFNKGLGVKRLHPVILCHGFSRYVPASPEDYTWKCFLTPVLWNGFVYANLMSQEIKFNVWTRCGANTFPKGDWCFPCWVPYISCRNTTTILTLNSQKSKPGMKHTLCKTLKQLFLLLLYGFPGLPGLSLSPVGLFWTAAHDWSVFGGPLPHSSTSQRLSCNFF